MHTRCDTHRGFECRGDDGWQPGLCDDSGCAPHPAQRCRFDDDQVGGVRPRHGERVISFAYKFVCGDENRNLRIVELGAQLLHVVNAPYGLFGVQQVVVAQGCERGEGLRQCPPGVCVYFEAGVGQGGAGGGDPGDVVVKGLSAFGDFNF